MGKIARLWHRVRLGLALLARRGPAVMRVHLQRTTLRRDQLHLEGQIETTLSIAGLSLIVRRFRSQNCDWPQTLTCMPMRAGGLNALLGLRQYHFKVTIDVPWSTLAPGLFGLEVHSCDTDRRFHLRAAPTGTGIFVLAENRTLCLFTEPSVGVVRIESHAIGKEALARLEGAAQDPAVKVSACIIGEYTNTARDNGIALHRGILHAQDPSISPTYVIEPESIDAIPIRQDNVIAWGSEAHLYACLNTKVCAFTHHRTYVYPAILQVIAPDLYSHTKTLFLQHGVMAMKGGHVVAHYHCSRVNYDAVIVSSQRERSIFANHFGYPEERIHVTGLPRLDRLYRKAKSVTPISNRVLVAPTWRPGLEKLSSEQVTNHSYFKNWRAALHTLRARGLDPVLIGHPILRKHVALMGAEPTKIYDNTTFQDTLLSASALVTDYSSTAWDALYVDRPVFLFHFDDSQDSFISNSALPGPVSKNLDVLANTLAAARANDWPFTATVARDLAFDHIDDENTNRVLALIRSLSVD